MTINLLKQKKQKKDWRDSKTTVSVLGLMRIKTKTNMHRIGSNPLPFHRVSYRGRIRRTKHPIVFFAHRRS